MKKQLLFVLSLCLLMSIVGTISAQWTADLNTGLRAYYPLNETSGSNVEDVINGNNMTTQNSPAWISDGCILGNCLDLDGVNQYATRTELSEINASLDYSLSFWFNTTNLASDDSLMHNALDANNIFSITLDTNELAIRSYGGAGNDNFTSSTSALTENTLYHGLVIHFGINNSLYYYQNGVLQTGTGNGFGGDTSRFDIGIAQAVYNPWTGTIDEVGVWNRTLTATEISQLYNGGAGITYSSSFPPSVTLNSPADLSTSVSPSVTFNGTVTKASYGIANVSLILDGSYNETNSSGINDTDYLFDKTLAVGVHTWVYEVCDVSNTCVNSSSYTTTISVTQVNTNTYNPFTYETKNETFYTNVTTNGTSVSAAYLVYNGTSYSATVSNLESNNYNVTATIDVPLQVGNKTFYYNLTVGGINYSTSSYSQNISLTFLSACNSTYPTQFLNISFQDEADLSYINATIPSSSFTYYLGSGAINKSLTYTNTTENYNYSFCGTTGTETMFVEPYVQYKQGSSYPQRIWQPETQNYNSSVYNKVLYLLGSGDGLYVTFQVINLAEEAISGATMNATRNIGGSDVLVCTGLTDAAGTITCWLNPDFSHTISITKSGYTGTVFSLTPSQSSYTITLGAESSSDIDYSRGIVYSVAPNQDFLDWNSSYNFSYTINSTYWGLDGFGFSLYWGNDTLITSNSSTDATGGTITFYNYNLTTNQTSIYMDWYYEANSSFVNGTRTWLLQDITGRSFSLWHLFTDAIAYIDSGNLWGFDDFGKILLSIVVIIMVSGGASLRYGIRNDAFVTGIIFGMVFLLDIGLGFIPAISVGGLTPINHFVTFIAFIVLVAVIIKEERT